jgi:glycosyltransferase involved in cell wall biosynthesis
LYHAAALRPASGPTYTPPQVLAQNVPPETAVVIPTRDRWPLVRAALATALAQVDAPVRVVVVDDGSSEAPGVLAGLDDRVELLRNTSSRGVSAARNRGLAHVDAEWVAFLDDDDLWAPNHLAAVHDARRRSEAEAGPAGLLYASQVVCDLDRRIMNLRPASSADTLADDLLSQNAVGSPSCAVLRREAVRDAGGFDEGLSMLADWDLYLRLVERGRAVASAPFTVAYTLHGDNMHLSPATTLREMAVLQRRYGARAAARGRRLPHEGFARSVASTYRRAGRRRRAVAWYLRSAVATRTRRDLERAIGVVLGERVSELSGRKPPRLLDPEEGRWIKDVPRFEFADPAEARLPRAR